ncbi:unnamed protein product, partial [Closterium sp. NIES-53]
DWQREGCLTPGHQKQEERTQEATGERHAAEQWTDEAPSDLQSDQCKEQAQGLGRQAVIVAVTRQTADTLRREEDKEEEADQEPAEGAERSTAVAVQQLPNQQRHQRQGPQHQQKLQPPGSPLQQQQQHLQQHEQHLQQQGPQHPQQFQRPGPQYEQHLQQHRQQQQYLQHQGPQHPQQRQLRGPQHQQLHSGD